MLNNNFIITQEGACVWQFICFSFFKFETCTQGATRYRLYLYHTALSLVKCPLIFCWIPSFMWVISYWAAQLHKKHHLTTPGLLELLFCHDTEQIVPSCDFSFYLRLISSHLRGLYVNLPSFSLHFPSYCTLSLIIMILTSLGKDVLPSFWLHKPRTIQSSTSSKVLSNAAYKEKKSVSCWYVRNRTQRQLFQSCLDMMVTRMRWMLSSQHLFWWGTLETEVWGRNFRAPHL